MKSKTNDEVKNKVTKEVKSEVKCNEILEVLNRIFICGIVIALILVVNTIVLISNNSKLNDYSTTSSGGNNNNNNQNETGEYDVSDFKEIKASELVNSTKGKTLLVYIGRSTCSWCVKFIPVLKEAKAQYKIEILYIDISKIIDFNAGGEVIDQAAFDIMTNLDSEGDHKKTISENFGATPMSLIMKDGKVVDTQIGYSESISTLLENNGIKK